MEDGIQPSEEQQQIIESKGNSIVVSNPGTGKTTTLSLKVVQLLEEGVDPDDIVCITFTKKAKKEMYDAINRQGRDKFSAHVKKVHIHTFHSFAYERLLDSGQIDEMAVDENRIRYSIYKSFKDNKAFNYSKKYVIDEIVPAATNAIQYIKSFGVTPDRISIPEVSARLEQDHKDYIEKSSYTMEEMQAFLKYFTAAYKDYEESKQDAIDYTDMLIKFLERFDGPLFKHALIDEMQDMNRMEAEIARRVAENIFLVGDEKQAIFGFQGGSTEYLKDFQKICEKLLLSANRRSTNQILDYAKRYYLDRAGPDEEAKEDLEKFRSDKSGEMPLVISTKAPYLNMLRLVRENLGKRIGILTRSNYQIVRISELLDAEKIPHRITASKITADKAKEHIASFLEGMLHDDVKYKIQAALTVLSPYPLDEALELAETLDADRGEGRDDPGLEKMKKWGCGMTADELDELFDNTILPICVAHGPEWFSTAVSIKQNIDQYLTFDFPTREGLFEYLAIGAKPGAGAEGGRWDDDKTDAGKKTGGGDITVSTVHKAKGQEYDVVIYLPKETRGDRTKFIDIVKTAIMQSVGTDVSGELEGEQSRLHFVAFTRARERLAVITSDGKDFGIKGLCELVEDESMEEEEAGPTAAEKEQARYREAYSMFVAGKLKESMSLLGRDGRDGWIEKRIADYFESLERLSYSGIAAKPSKFLKNIFSIPRAENKGTIFGRNFHRAMYDVLSGKQDAEGAAEDYDTDGSGTNERMKESIRNALDAIGVLGSEYRNLKVHALEKRMEVPVSDITNYDGDGMIFSGQIDAIFRHDSGYLVIDYKTDRTATNASDHRKQLSAYKKMLSRTEDIPEDKIDTHIIFASMTGSINTGKNDYEVSKTKRDAYSRFEKDLRKVLGWKQDSSRFVDDLLEEDADMDSPYDAIMENLKRTRTGRTKS
ncbi:MAG: ATP-dependent helicase [Nitrosopumilaceae archaeon]|nr:ATP-dependent helicase [Nitrosopumilaceae archaeon]